MYFQGCVQWYMYYVTSAQALQYGTKVVVSHAFTLHFIFDFQLHPHERSNANYEVLPTVPRSSQCVLRLTYIQNCLCESGLVRGGGGGGDHSVKTYQYACYSFSFHLSKRRLL